MKNLLILTESEVSQAPPIFDGRGKKEGPVVSFVMPAFNEEHEIVEAVRRVLKIAERMKVEYEVVVVNDGSTDKTSNKVKKFADGNHQVALVGYPQNKGKGHAVKHGFQYTQGEYIVFLDSDLEIDVAPIHLYIKALHYGDLVMASKWHPDSQVEIPLIRKFLSHGFNLLANVLTGIRLGDTQTGLKAVRRKALKEIFSKLSVKGYAFDAELLVLCHLSDLTVVQLPVKLRMNSGFSLKTVGNMLLDLLGITYRLRILKWYPNLTQKIRTKKTSRTK